MEFFFLHNIRISQEIIAVWREALSVTFSQSDWFMASASLSGLSCATVTDQSESENCCFTVVVKIREAW